MRGLQQNTSRSHNFKVNSSHYTQNNALRWRHNGHDGVSNHQPHHCLLNRLLSCRSKKTSKLRVTGLCAGNSPVTGEFPAQMTSNAKNVSIWWRNRGIGTHYTIYTDRLWWLCSFLTHRESNIPVTTSTLRQIGLHRDSTHDIGGTEGTIARSRLWAHKVYKDHTKTYKIGFVI